MYTIVLFPIPGRDYPFGYLLAAIFLIIAIVLFIISIFMKDNTRSYDESYDENWNEFESDDSSMLDGEYNESYDGYGIKGAESEAALLKKETVELKNLVADVTSELQLTKAFKASNENEAKQDEPSKYETQIFMPKEEQENISEASSEDESGIWDNFQNFMDNSNGKEAVSMASSFNEEFSEELDSNGAENTAQERESVKPSNVKPGLSFAEEVKRLIEEEERRNKK